MSRRMLFAGVAIAAAGVVLLLPGGSASAHPLGNLTVNTYAGIVVARDRVRVDYVLDLAELPTVQAKQRIDSDGDGSTNPAELDAYRLSECSTLARGLDLELGSAPLTLAPDHSSLRFLPGQGGLQTLRLECALTAPARVTTKAHVTFEDTNLTDRIGWREITFNGDGTTLSGSDAPTSSRSNRLLAYPTNGRSPLRELSASANVRGGGPRLAPTATPTATPIAPQARGADPLTSWFQRTVGERNLTAGLALLALLVAVVLGGLHAMAPGHGKTMMAAYVVGRRGTPRQVAAIGLTVAITHTGGVLALGTIIWLSRAVAPDRLLPWLTVASGSMLALCGAALLYRRVVLDRTGHSHLRLPGLPDHDHPHPHDHPHHDHLHDHDHHHHGDHDHPHHHDLHDDDPAPFRKAWLVLMGVAGGLVPTPSALVVLLGAAALHRIWFGIVLVTLYGLGMATSLMGAGLLLVRAQSWLEHNWYARPRAALLLRYLPAITALLLVGGGLSVILRGAAQL
jgi:nickel/cobalt transporter (NicO) family protein